MYRESKGGSHGNTPTRPPTVHMVTRLLDLKCAMCTKSLTGWDATDLGDRYSVAINLAGRRQVNFTKPFLTIC